MVDSTTLGRDLLLELPVAAQESALLKEIPTTTFNFQFLQTSIRYRKGAHDF